MVPGQRQSIGVGWVQTSGFTSQKLAILLTGNDINCGTFTQLCAHASKVSVLALQRQVDWYSLNTKVCILSVEVAGLF